MINIKSFSDVILESETGSSLWAVCYEGEEKPDFFGLYRTKREAIYAKSKSDLGQLVEEYDWQFKKGGYTGTFGDWMEEFDYNVDNYPGLVVEEIDIEDESKHEEYILRAMSEPPYTGAVSGAPTQSGADMVRMLIDSGVNPVRSMRGSKKLIDRIERDRKAGRDVSWATPQMLSQMGRVSKTRDTFGV